MFNPFPLYELNSVLLTPITPLTNGELSHRIDNVGYHMAIDGGYEIIIFDGGFAIQYRHEEDEQKNRNDFPTGSEIEIDGITYKITWNILVNDEED